VVKKSLSGTISVSVMLLFIMAFADVYSQILAISGGANGAINFILSLHFTPMQVFIIMQVIVAIMGLFMGLVPIMMITIPIFMPIVNALDINAVWFCIVYLLNLEMATTSPPFGMGLFVMKGVAPKDVTMGDCYRAALPFLGCDLIAMILIIIFPQIALWLPGLMR
jgi:TRAP-type mannitol/chloroaromatic compound transport system permease large subunit